MDEHMRWVWTDRGMQQLLPGMTIVGTPYRTLFVREDEVLEVMKELGELRDLKRRHLAALDGMARILRDLEPVG